LYFIPDFGFIDQLERFGHKDKRTPAVELDCELRFSAECVARSVIVPYRITFAELHEVLQAAYNWGGERPYSFRFPLFKDAPRSMARITIFPGEDFDTPTYLANDDEDVFGLLELRRVHPFYDNDINLICEPATLPRLLPRLRYFEYRWGEDDDPWGHDIELKRLHRNYRGPLPDLLSGSGEALPKDSVPYQLLVDLDRMFPFRAMLAMVGLASPEDDYEPQPDPNEGLLGSWSWVREPFELEKVRSVVRQIQLPSLKA
jgi:hypothetical protein